MSLSLITGFPGFIGRRLVARLLDDPEARVAALVEHALAVARAAQRPWRSWSRS